MSKKGGGALTVCRFKGSMASKRGMLFLRGDLYPNPHYVRKVDTLIHIMLEKFSANDFALSEAENSFSGPLNRRGIIDLPLLKRH